MAQPVDLVVDRRVLLDVRVGRGDVGLGLVVVVVGDEVLDRVVGKNSRNSLQSCAASVLLWAITSAGRCDCSMTRAIVTVLPVAGDAQQRLEALAARSPSESSSIAPGWSPVGSNEPVKRNGGIGFQGSRGRGLGGS